MKITWFVAGISYLVLCDPLRDRLSIFIHGYQLQHHCFPFQFSKLDNISSTLSKFFIAWNILLLCVVHQVQ